ncbi:MAG TPA: PQQ-binding-like beta-propeller repeat protein, partial [Planctomycetota bacterium]|nr:PQQ-binding-like beta-propeller repeat protein [Planctomycetota bacterium]
MSEYRVRRIPFALALALGSVGLGANWPQWRGPTVTGVTDEKGFPTTWGGKDGANVLWKAELPKNEESPSSPIVWGDRVFVTVSLKDDGHRVACYARADGKLLWDTPVEKGPWKKTDSRGGVCAPTPCTDGERVFALFGTAVLAALNAADGKMLWSIPLAQTDFDVAMGSSPIVHGDTVVLLSGLTKRNSNLTAFDKKTGKVKWELKLPDHGFCHSTPAFATVGGRTILVLSVNRRSAGILGVDPEKGELLWSAPGDGETATPAIGSGVVYCDSARGGGGYALELAKTVGAKEVALKWQLSRVNMDLSSPLIVGDLVYRLGGNGWLNCLKLENGEKVYSEQLQS